ncbi:MAG: hypothetical protein ACK44E_08830 [Anaerolineales bacterium]
MAERMVRTQLLLTPQQYQRLCQLAQQENRSLSDVTRELLTLALRQKEQSLQDRLSRVQAARQVAVAILQSKQGKPLNIDSVALLQEVREERLNVPLNRD